MGWEVRNGLHYDRHGKVQMTCTATRYQPTALRLADALMDGMSDEHWNQLSADAAAELRRLHAENEALRVQIAAVRVEVVQAKKERDTAEMMSLAIKAQDEALLRQALEVMEWVEPSGTTGHGGIEARKQAIAALRERLGVSE